MSSYSTTTTATSSAASQLIAIAQSVTRASVIAVSLLTSAGASTSMLPNFGPANATQVSYLDTPAQHKLAGSMDLFAAGVSHVDYTADYRALISYVDTKTAIYQKLDRFQQKYGNLAAAVADARAFVGSMPSEFPTPNIWTDGAGEIAFEWATRDRRAFVTFEGDGGYGYTLKIGDKFVPGQMPGDLGKFPMDLLNYLRENA